MAFLKVSKSGTDRRSEDGYVFSVSVDEAEGLDPEIFVFQKVGPTTNDAVFSNIASLADMNEYPADDVDENTEFPFFRLSSATLAFRNIPLADDAWIRMQADIDRLVTMVTRIEDGLTLEEEVTFGTESSSSSS